MVGARFIVILWRAVNCNLSIDMNLHIFLLACSLAAISAQRLTETSTDATDSARRSVGSYGLLRPNYAATYPGAGYQGGYGGYQSGYGGYQGGYGGYQGGYGGSYPGQPYPGVGGGYGGYQGGYPGYTPGGVGGYPGYGGYRPRPGYDYRAGYNYPGAIGYPGYNRPGYNPYRPGYDRQYPNNPGNYFGSFNDGYSDNYRLLGRKVGETKKEEEA